MSQKIIPALAVSENNLNAWLCKIANKSGTHTEYEPIEGATEAPFNFAKTVETGPRHVAQWVLAQMVKFSYQNNDKDDLTDQIAELYDNGCKGWQNMSLRELLQEIQETGVWEMATDEEMTFPVMVEFFDPVFGWLERDTPS